MNEYEFKSFSIILDRLMKMEGVRVKESDNGVTVVVAEDDDNGIILSMSIKKETNKPKEYKDKIINIDEFHICKNSIVSIKFKVMYMDGDVSSRYKVIFGNNRNEILEKWNKFFREFVESETIILKETCQIINVSTMDQVIV